MFCFLAFDFFTLLSSNKFSIQFKASFMKQISKQMQIHITESNIYGYCKYTFIYN